MCNLATVFPDNDTAALHPKSFLDHINAAYNPVWLITNIKTFYLKPGCEKIKFITNKHEGNRDVNACIFIVLELKSEAC